VGSLRGCAVRICSMRTHLGCRTSGPTVKTDHDETLDKGAGTNMKCCVAPTLYLSRISIDDIGGQRLQTAIKYHSSFACIVLITSGTKVLWKFVWKRGYLLRAVLTRPLVDTARRSQANVS
jgi:hypothetical protein